MAVDPEFPINAIGNSHDALAGRHMSIIQMIRYFSWAHLPERLQPVSKACGDLAFQMLALLPDGPETTAGMRKLLEAKDCFVRAALYPREE